MDYTDDLFLKKQLVLAVCEPHIRKVEVKCRNSKFCMFKFGSLELGDEEYVFGIEENKYKSTYADKTEINFPIVIARKKASDYELTPLSSFSKDEQDMISDSISYTLEVQQTMSHYMLARC